MFQSKITHFHLFCGIGGGAAGFNRGSARAGNLVADFSCLGGIDSDPDAISDFSRIAGVPGTVMDLFSREQYETFHGCAPPADWREALPDDIRAASGGQCPDIVFTSAPCKGFSTSLHPDKVQARKYQALNSLTLRGIYLALEAWKDDGLPAFFLFENVPAIRSRGRHFLDQITSLLQSYGYAVAETTHNCGSLGGLAQSRPRFLLVARHMEHCPPFLYEPPEQPLHGVGEVLEKLPLPGDVSRGGLMHRVPRLKFRTWLRLAMVEAGGDWRSLNRLRVRDGVLSDYCLQSDAAEGVLRVASRSSSGFEVPSVQGGRYSQAGVVPWDDHAGTIAGESYPSNGRFSVADPRFPADGNRHKNVFKVTGWGSHSGTVTGCFKPSSGGGVSDPRCSTLHPEPIGNSLPKMDKNGLWIIVASDGCWHRPFTTLELAALQGFIGDETPFSLEGDRDGAWRERIGNAVPVDAAAEIASVMGHAILLARTGQTFALGSTPIWVRPIAIGLSLEHDPRTTFGEADNCAA